ncbi:hypothetical protein [Chitinophaga niabensis]|uniref:Uncharacterized protein n=1 Tax=Chitinophaga niabensis TaxID=536979 RepID=A0A1N6E2I4_9BACT|nr:hypothetical protein [Chitinophaga niabensis]SIN77265.1 hypothetical protein SAMN04488055_1257 [Chitinophaga niabensis]
MEFLKEPVVVLILGVICIIASWLLRHLVKRRRFNRRNGAGVQQFSTYEQKYIKQKSEVLISLLSLLLFVGGAYLIILYFISK